MRDEAWVERMRPVVEELMAARLEGREANLFKHQLAGADLRGAQLGGVILEWADLSGADLTGAYLGRAKLAHANLTGAVLIGVNLDHACLRMAKLSGTDLSGANIDFASWPVWCGSVNVTVDTALFCQLAFHLAAVSVEDPECRDVQKSLLEFARKLGHWSEASQNFPGYLKEVEE